MKLNNVDILEVVYKIPGSTNSGGLENYALRLSKLLNKKGFKVAFAYSYEGIKPSPLTDNDIQINVSNIKLFKKLIFNVRLYNYIKKTGYNGIIHINGDNGVFCTRLNGTKTVFTLHGSSLQYASFLIGKTLNPLTIFAELLSGLMELYAYYNADVVVSVSKYVAAYMRKYKNRIVKIIPPSIEKPKITKSKKACKKLLGLKSNSPTFLFMGGVNKRKGFFTAIKVMQKVKDKNAKLLIVGSGRKPTLPKNCVFLGRVSNSKLETIYNASDILFLPSNYEGFPTVIPEAMSFGVVPMVFNRLPFTEVVNSTNGFLANTIFDYVKIIDGLSSNTINYRTKEKLCQKQSKNFYTNIIFRPYIMIFKKLLKY